MEQNILVLGFDEDSKAFQAFSVLKHSAAQGSIELEDGVVVERDVQGTLHIREQVSTAARMPGTALGGLLSAVIGLLGGPGTTGVIAIVTEAAEEVVNGEMRQFDAVVLRSPVSDAQAEISAHGGGAGGSQGPAGAARRGAPHEVRRVASRAEAAAVSPGGAGQTRVCPHLDLKLTGRRTC
jgi:uncharacterized membrane protein